MRYLFGPVNATFAAEELGEARTSGECLTFNGQQDEYRTDVHIMPGDSWEDVTARWPGSWRPDVVFLFLAYDAIPPCIWTQGIPVVGLLADWNLLWHERRRLFPCCDLLFTDRAGVGAVMAAGEPDVEFANLYGLSPAVPATPPDSWRDLDVVFAGNLHPSIQRERLPWLRRLAQLSDRRRVRVASHLPRPEYHRLLRRARIVFNRAMRGEANARVAEAVAAGALLFQERENREVGHLLEPDVDYVTYDAEDFEERVEYFLADEEARLARCRSAQAKLAALRWPHHWQDVTRAVEAKLPRLRELARARQTAVAEGQLTPACELPRHQALDCVMASPGEAVEVERGAELRRVAVCRAVGLSAPLPLDAYPGGFGAFRTAWEEAAWRNAGRPAEELWAKLRLLEAEAWFRLAEQSSAPAFLYEGLARRRDFTAAHRLLGHVHLAAREPALALPHLRQAYEANPLDAVTARLLDQALNELNCPEQRRLLREGQRRLAQAAPGVLEREPWLFPDAAREADLASIIIPCCGRVDLTRACVASVRRHTARQYELVFIDNGSSDGTGEYLSDLERELGPDRVMVVRNAKNLGFAGAVNQGLTAARGRFLVLLNNDTLPQAGWLDRLICCLVSQWPQLGAAGPVSNAAPPPQQVPMPLRTRQDLDAFAAARRAAYFGQAFPVPRLSGVCLALTRESVAAVGPFDPRFGLGFFEDDDYCLRLREAGFGLAVVADAFVFHHGSETFAALDIDQRRLLDENFRRFTEKWGPDRTAGYRPCALEAPVREEAAADPPAVVPAGPFDVALTMIVRDEETNLEACLAPVRGLFREIVVVDTGSRDGTRALAQRLATRIVDFPWVDSFAAARNAALESAVAPWVFWLDADDRVDDENQARLAALFATLGGAPADLLGVSMKCMCAAAGGGPATVVDHVRLFRRHPDVRWEYRVHEQILPSIRRAGGRVSFANHVAIHHTGYQEPRLRRSKLERDLRLLRHEDADHPDDPFTMFNLGAVCLEQGRAEEALVYLGAEPDPVPPRGFHRPEALRAGSSGAAGPRADAGSPGGVCAGPSSLP